MEAAANAFFVPAAGRSNQGLGHRAETAAEKRRATIQIGRDQDTVVYAAVANYRQYLELAMKGLTQDARLLLDPGEVAMTHYLFRLWRHLRPLLVRVAPSEEPTLDYVEATIRRFADMDPRPIRFGIP